jgi:phosphotriesterase-related protein
VGNILAHDHMFVEFGVDNPVAYLTADKKDVYDVIGPLVLQAKNLGYSVFVETGPDGIGRRPDIINYIAKKTKMPTMMVTGIYHEPNVPQWVYNASVQDISKWMQKELNQGIENTGVKAGFIKVSQSWGGATPTELKVLEAACHAAKATNATVASHILQGQVALDVIDAFESFGCSAERFVWVHAPYTAFTDDQSYLMAAAAKGAYISCDFIGSKFWAGWLNGDNNDSRQLALIKDLVTNGYEDQIIIGQDCGWYDPGFPAGFEIQGYDHIARVFVPLMESSGFSHQLIRKLLHDNPWNAYSR